MPSIQLLVDSADAHIGETLYRDLSRRGWSVFMGAFGTEILVGEDQGVDTIVCWLPAQREKCSDALDLLHGLENVPIPVTLAIPPNCHLPPWLGARSSTRVILQNRVDYDRAFEDVFRALLSPWPAWLDVRVRPSVIERPTGVDWWSEDLLVADERFEHLIRIGPDTMTVLLSGLSEPHHVFVDRRQVLIANKSANEVLVFRLVDDMATDIFTLRHCQPNQPLAHPHAAAQSHDRVAIADTDNNQVFVGHGQLHRNRIESWTVLKDSDHLRTPCAVFIDGRFIWVASTFTHEIVAFDHSGSWVGSFGKYGDGPGEFRFPVAIAVWQDNMFVADEENKRLQVLQIVPPDEGLLKPLISGFGAPWVRSPFGLGVNRENKLAIVDRDYRCVWIADLGEALDAKSA